MRGCTAALAGALAAFWLTGAAAADDSAEEGQDPAYERGWANPVSGEYARGFWEVPKAAARRLLDTSTGALVADGIFLGLAGGLLALDEDIAEFWQDDVRSEGTDDVLDSLTGFGDFRLMSIGLAGGYLASGAVGEYRLQRTAMYAWQSMAIATAATESLKRLSGRTRPRNTGDAFDFDGPSTDDDSFPSGDATTAWAVATVFAKEYGEDTWLVPVASYALATGVSLQRINANDHWASDVFIGTALGYTVGSLVHAYAESALAKQMAIAPMPVDDGAGVQVSLRF